MCELSSKRTWSQFGILGQILLFLILLFSWLAPVYAAKYNMVTLESQFGWAYRIALDSKRGKVYVVDYTRHLVRQIDMGLGAQSYDGTPLYPDAKLKESCPFCSYKKLKFSGKTSDNGKANNNGDEDWFTQFNRPTGIAIDQNGNLYIVVLGAAVNDGRVYKVDSRGVISTFAGGHLWDPCEGCLATNAKISQPQDVALDSFGNVYIADGGFSTVRKVDTHGIITTVAGIFSQEGYSGDGGPATKAKIRPWGITVDNHNNLFIVSDKNHTVRKVDLQTNIITTVAGIYNSPGYNGDNKPATQAQLKSPYDVAVDADGNLYIADKDNHRLRMVDTRGIIMTIVGNGKEGQGEIGDGGYCRYGQLSYPSDVTIDDLGNIYIAEIANEGRVRKCVKLPDREPPIAKINFPKNRDIIEKTIPYIEGTAFDAPGGSGLDYVEIQVIQVIDDQQKLYLTEAHDFSEDEGWIRITEGHWTNKEKWSYDINDISWTWDTTYIIKARAFDTADSAKEEVPAEKPNQSRVSSKNLITVKVVEDQHLPTVRIITPDPRIGRVQEVSQISGIASDTGTGLDRIEIQATDGELFLTELGLVNTPEWITLQYPEDFSNKYWANWSYATTFLRPSPYKITARAFDKAGNSIRDSVSLIVGNPEAQHHTTLSIKLTNQVVKHDSLVDADGILTRHPNLNIYPQGEKITLTILDPNNQVVHTDTNNTDAQGKYRFPNLSVFTQKGTYTLKVFFEGSMYLYQSEATAQVLVDESAGYAILIQGRLTNEEGRPLGEEAYNKTLNRIYQHRLLKRGFSADNIVYFNYDITQNGVYAAPSKEEIQNKIESWACERISSVPAPLYIVMIDHGDKNKFYLGEKEINPQELNSWLTNLENCLTQKNAQALEKARIIMIGTCYSGSFIPALSKLGRVIVTSATAEELSYKGLMETDGIQSGEFFMEQLFQQLDNGEHLQYSFSQASKDTNLFTKGEQHPLLDDNGDQKGSLEIPIVHGDGEKVALLYLGVDNYNSAFDNNIKAVTPTHRLHSYETAARLFVEVNAPSLVNQKTARIEVRSPSLLKALASGEVISDTESTEQKEIPSEIVFLKYVGNNRFEINYNEIDHDGFLECGLYEIFYILENKEGEILPLQRSLVYKQDKECPNQPPNPFLITSITRNADKSFSFVWEPTTDPDGEQVNYTLLIATDEQFTDIVYRQKSLTTTTITLDKKAGLPDWEYYFGKVQATDENGSVGTSDIIRFFKTPNHSLEIIRWHGCVEMQMVDAIGNPMSGVNFQFNPAQPPSKDNESREAEGYYIRCASPGTYNLKVKAPGYLPKTMKVKIRQGVTENIVVEPSPVGCVDMRVMSASGEKPIPGVAFNFLPPRSIWEDDKTNEAQGNYIRCASKGEYEITINAPGYVSQTQKVVIYQGVTEEIEVKLPPVPQTRLINISTRAPIRGEKYNVIAGFVSEGSGMQKVFLKGVAMEPGVDPKLCLHKHPSNELIVCNDDWQAGENAEEIAQLPKHMIADMDAGLLLELPAGAYTVILSSVGVDGIGRVGVNAIDSTNTQSAKLINLSTRAPIEGGAGNIIAGFVIDGTGTLQVFIKGIGMEPQGVDTKLCLHKHPSNELVTCNDNWQDGPNADKIANLPNHGLTETDAGLWLNLPVGAYTAILSSEDANNAKVLGRVGVTVID